jgi:photosystem II stability/assembly factor-like uncharacterized protein
MKAVRFIYAVSAMLAGLIIGLAAISCGEKTETGRGKFIKTCNGETNIPRLSREAHIEQLQKYFDGIQIPFGAKKPPAPAGYIVKEYLKVRSAKGIYKAAKNNIEWIMRGPANVGGRTRGLIVDPDDPSYLTWYAGSASGGTWKTTDGGHTWIYLTDSIPLQATTTLAMAKSNHNVIYMGSGESFDGSMYTTGGGIFKSTDRGETWELLSSTLGNEDFRYVNRIEVHPDSEDTLLVATNTGIFKSVDGGSSWYQTYISTYEVEDLVADTSNFNYMYASENSIGVIRSENAGENWEVCSSFPAGFGRVELAVSPTNPSKIYASIETSSSASDLFSSADRGLNWQRMINSGGPNHHYLGGQGMYDNTIAVHPYNENIVFWGGVNLWRAELSGIYEDGEGAVTGFQQINTQSFLDFIPFNGNLLPGLSTGDLEDAISLEDSDFVSVEIRFGPGKSQKAHRFFVPEGATSGVDYMNYSYQDYIDVPFEVWDVTNNIQLMCSFRDQERDGAFNLYERTGDDYGELGREYLFINAVPYNATTPDPNIAVQGGRSYKLIYFFWPTLAPGGTWDPESLPDSKIFVEWSIVRRHLAQVSNVSDAYGAFGGNNPYDQNTGLNGTVIPGLHPDHHELIMIPIDEGTEDFWILNSNDGGVSLSTDGGVLFKQLPRNFITTQFYGVAKKPSMNEYIGGMQDNGTWQSPANIEASLDTGYFFRLGGDGFEAVWNQQDATRIMASMYNNNIFTSFNGGKTWNSATTGMTSNDGPFITRLTALPSNNNVVFAIGSEGIYKTVSFALNGWESIEVGDGWVPSGYSNYWNQVKISLANEEIMWAGAGMYPPVNLKLFVSTDQGDNFVPVSPPSEPIPAFSIGIATHPTEENTAYVLYGLYGSPKILRTEDLGKTWEDITQVDSEGESVNGFPDVSCWSLFVFPDDVNRIWAGTDIGIMESTDNGETWHYLSGFPAVPVWQIFIQDNQIVATTYGRGIMTYQYGDQPSGVIENKLIKNDAFSVFPNPTSGIIHLTIPSDLQSEKIGIEVYSLNGKLAYSGRITPANSNGFTIDLSAVDPGIYIIAIRTEGELYTERIVVE